MPGRPQDIMLALEERYPQPALLPPAGAGREEVRVAAAGRGGRGCVLVASVRGGACPPASGRPGARTLCVRAQALAMMEELEGLALGEAGFGYMAGGRMFGPPEERSLSNVPKLREVRARACPSGVPAGLNAAAVTSPRAVERLPPPRVIVALALRISPPLPRAPHPAAGVRQQAAGV